MLVRYFTFFPHAPFLNTGLYFSLYVQHVALRLATFQVIGSHKELVAFPLDGAVPAHSFHTITFQPG